MSKEDDLALTRQHIATAKGNLQGLLADLAEIAENETERLQLEQEALKTLEEMVARELARLREIGVDIGVVITDKKTHEGKMVRGTAGLDAVDMSASPVRASVPAGMGGVTDAPSHLTFINGAPAGDIAILEYLGVPIADICALQIDHAHMAASYFETALSVDADERNDIRKAAAAKKKVTFVPEENTHTKGVLTDEAKVIEYNKAIAGATYIEPELQAQLRTILSGFGKGEDTMDMLAALTSKMNASDNLALGTEAQRKHAAIRSMAVMPVLVGMINSHISDTEFKFPEKEELEHFNYAENFCKMMSLPTDEATVEGMNLFLLLHLDHEMNASTTAVKGTMSADNRLWASLTSGVQTLHGKRHGGANFDVLQNLDRVLALNLDEIQSMGTEEIFNLPQSLVEERGVKAITPEEATAKITAYLDKYAQYVDEQAANPNKFLIPGIGHRVYKKLDPRADVIKKAYEKVCDGKDIQDPLFILAKELEKQVKERGFDKKGLFPNVDFYSGLMLRQLGINPRMMTPMFAVGRTPGWVSQGLEHYSRQIVRPFQVYIGEIGVNLAERVVGAFKAGAEAIRGALTGGGQPDETAITDVTVARQLFQNLKQKMAGRAATA